MTYQDKCYCMRSNKRMCKAYDLEYCTNTDCWRHADEIPGNLPEWELIAWSEFKNCKEHRGR